MNRFTPTLRRCLIIGCLLVLVGCGGAGAPPPPAADTGAHDHGDTEEHPKTYAEAVERLVSIDQTIRTAFAANDEEAAHAPLHDVGHLLEDIAALSATAEMSDEQRASVQQAVDTLFELYGAVDDTMHGREGKSYDEVSSDVDATIVTLKSATTPTAEKVSTDEANE